MARKVIYLRDEDLEAFNQYIRAIRMAVGAKTDVIPSESEVLRQAVIRWSEELQKKQGRS